MKSSHELAKLLLSLPNMPIATHANNHTFMSNGDQCGFKIGRLESSFGPHIVIGNISKLNINKPNWWISEMYVGKVPEEWEKW